VPRGIEVLVKKAAVDPAFRELLLARRAEAASEIGLALEPAEAAMLDAIPAAQLEAIIARTTVDPMLGVIGAAVGAQGCTMGARIDRPLPGPVPLKAEAEPPPVTNGIRPDRP
jgi:hypothetical protein